LDKERTTKRNSKRGDQKKKKPVEKGRVNALGKIRRINGASSQKNARKKKRRGGEKLKTHQKSPTRNTSLHIEKR